MVRLQIEAAVSNKGPQVANSPFQATDRLNKRPPSPYSVKFGANTGEKRAIGDLRTLICVLSLVIGRFNDWGTLNSRAVIIDPPPSGKDGSPTKDGPFSPSNRGVPLWASLWVSTVDPTGELASKSLHCPFLVPLFSIHLFQRLSERESMRMDVKVTAMRGNIKTMGKLPSLWMDRV